MIQTGKPLSPEAALERFAASVASAVGPETARTVTRTEGDPQGRARDRADYVQAYRQANLERIIALAAGEFRPLEGAASVDQAWLVRFLECAQDVADESEQAIWARLLARELAEPGGVSLRTVRFLAAMDRWEVDGLAEYAAFAFSFESGARFVFHEDFARREMWILGRELDLTQHFIEIGVLASETARVKARTARGLRLRYRDKTYEFRPGAGPLDESPAGEAGFSYRKFTPVGQQLADAVKCKSFFGYARNVINALNAQLPGRFELIEKNL